MSGRKVFAVGEVLQAADVNDFLMDQSVMVFAGSAARGSAIPSPSEGMVTYRSDDDTVEVFDGSAFVPVGAAPAILQVVSTTKSDTFTTASASFVDVTGLSASITPSSTSSKVLVLLNVQMNGTTGTVAAFMKLVRDSTDISVGDAAGSRTRAGGVSVVGADNISSIAGAFVDSPNTNSATTYKIQLRGNVASTVTINRASSDPDAATTARTISSITLLEVAG